MNSSYKTPYIKARHFYIILHAVFKSNCTGKYATHEISRNKTLKRSKYEICQNNKELNK